MVWLVTWSIVNNYLIFRCVSFLEKTHPWLRQFWYWNPFTESKYRCEVSFFDVSSNIMLARFIIELYVCMISVSAWNEAENYFVSSPRLHYLTCPQNSLSALHTSPSFEFLQASFGLWNISSVCSSEWQYHIMTLGLVSMWKMEMVELNPRLEILIITWASSLWFANTFSSSCSLYCLWPFYSFLSDKWHSASTGCLTSSLSYLLCVDSDSVMQKSTLFCFPCVGLFSLLLL